jgi:hypothetical protein
MVDGLSALNPEYSINGILESIFRSRRGRVARSKTNLATDSNNVRVELHA